MEKGKSGLINTFRIDNLTFELFKNKDGSFYTLSKDDDFGETQKTDYIDIDELEMIFSDDLTLDEILGKNS